MPADHYSCITRDGKKGKPVPSRPANHPSKKGRANKRNRVENLTPSRFMADRQVDPSIFF